MCQLKSITFVIKNIRTLPIFLYLIGDMIIEYSNLKILHESYEGNRDAWVDSCNGKPSLDVIYKVK